MQIGVNITVNVLSLFDGISSAQVALQQLGISHYKYYASEINKDAIRVTQFNYPRTIQLGDINNWISWDINWKSIDLVFAGSPCQGFSSAGKGLNFNDPRSRLFFTFMDVLKHVTKYNPKVLFLFENVVMKKEWETIITDFIGCSPIKINSALVSAQNRVRLYWTNIPNISQPEDRGILLKDILVSEKDWNKATIVGRRINATGHREDYNKSISITQCLEVRALNTTKSNCLTTVDKDNVLTPLGIGRYVDVFIKKIPFRYYNRVEYERLQTFPDGYTASISERAAKKCLGNAWNVNTITHILQSM